MQFTLSGYCLGLPAPSTPDMTAPRPTEALTYSVFKDRPASTPRPFIPTKLTALHRLCSGLFALW